MTDETVAISLRDNARADLMQIKNRNSTGVTATATMMESEQKKLRDFQNQY